MTPVKTLGERIADALVEDGLLTAEQVAELLEKQKKEGTRFIKLVVEKAYVTDNDLVVAMGRVLNTPPVNISRVTIPSDLADLVPRDMRPTTRSCPFPASATGCIWPWPIRSMFWRWTTLNA
jgi:hypothetical protein